MFDPILGDILAIDEMIDRRAEEIAKERGIKDPVEARMEVIADARTEQNLKRCPFCGGKAYIKVESDSFSNIQSIIRCSECCTTMVVDVDMTKSDDWNKQKAIEKWNRRTEA